MSLFCLIWINVNAQDKIYKKNGALTEAKVLVVGVEEIKYQLNNTKAGKNNFVKKVDLLKIEYQDGRKETYKYEGNDPELYAPQKTLAVKFNYFAPLFGYSVVNFEKKIKYGRSIEFSVGLIGLGIKQELHTLYGSYATSTIYLEQSGTYGAIGYKFIKAPKKLKYVARQTHFFQGLYLKPQFIYGSYKANRGYTETAGSLNTEYYEKKTTVFGSLLINAGKQWVYDDFIMLDLYGGVGYVINNQRKVNGNNSFNTDGAGFHYGALSTGHLGVNGIGITGGIKIGVMIGK